MYYGIKLKRTVIGPDGSDKLVAEDYLTDVEFFAEAENKVFDVCFNECDVIAIKRLPNLKGFVNTPITDDEYIYMATIVETTINENDGSTAETKFNVAVYACDINSATKILNEYIGKSVTDLTLVSVKRTKIISEIE